MQFGAKFRVRFMNLSELQKGQSGTISSFSDEEMSVKLMEMGCLPGESVRVDYIAAFGDPMVVTVAGYQLSMRKSEAATIILTPTD